MAGLCGRGCQAGRGGEPLASSVYLEAEIVARPGCCRGGCFHAGWGWGVPCCTHPRAARGVPAMGRRAGTWRCPRGARPCRLPQLEPEEGCGDGAQAIREVGDTAGHPLPCSIAVLQGSTGSPRMCPHAGWVPVLAACPHAVRGSPSLPLHPQAGRVSILAACPCSILSSLYWLWGPTLAVDVCTSSVPMQAVRPCASWVPVLAASPGGHRRHLAAPGERGHPRKRWILSLCEPGLTATRKLPGRERGQ